MPHGRTRPSSSAPVDVLLSLCEPAGSPPVTPLRAASLVCRRPVPSRPHRPSSGAGAPPSDELTRQLVLFPQVVHRLVAQRNEFTVMLDETAIAEEHEKLKQRDQEHARRASRNARSQGRRGSARAEGQLEPSGFLSSPMAFRRVAVARVDGRARHRNQVPPHRASMGSTDTRSLPSLFALYISESASWTASSSVAGGRE